MNDPKAIFVNLADRHLADVLAVHDRISAPERADANTAAQGGAAISGNQMTVTPTWWGKGSGEQRRLEVTSDIR